MRAGSGVLGSIAKKSQQVSLHKLRLSPSNCKPSMGSPCLLPCWVPGASQRLGMFTFFPWLLLKVWPTPLTGQTPSLSCTCLSVGQGKGQPFPSTQFLSPVCIHWNLVLTWFHPGIISSIHLRTVCTLAPQLLQLLAGAGTSEDSRPQWPPGRVPIALWPSFQRLAAAAPQDDHVHFCPDIFLISGSCPPRFSQPMNYHLFTPAFCCHHIASDSHCQREGPMRSFRSPSLSRFTTQAGLTPTPLFPFLNPQICCSLPAKATHSLGWRGAAVLTQWWANKSSHHPSNYYWAVCVCPVFCKVFSHPDNNLGNTRYPHFTREEDKGFRKIRRRSNPYTHLCTWGWGPHHCLPTPSGSFYTVTQANTVSHREMGIYLAGLF